MPYKYNESHRDKIKKSRYRVTNWRHYNNALRRRGDITIWFTSEAIAAWRPAKTGLRGRPQEYSDLTMEAAGFIREIFHLPLQQTEGFMNSIARMMDADISIPDYSCISKRSAGLSPQLLAKATQPGSLVIVDSTGLKVYGKDEWHQEKHTAPARRTWRKLHLAVDENHQLVACELTTTELGDSTAVPDLLAQVLAGFDTFIADGAYDGDPVYQAVTAKQQNAAMVVPPDKTAVLSKAGDTQRDQHIRTIQQRGRMPWQKQVGYHLRNYADAVQRFKRIFANTLKAHALPQQKAEARIGASALNRMTKLGMPISVKIS
ncbi:MAG: IS5 family transposase [Pseudomonadota bacterium]